MNLVILIYMNTTQSTVPDESSQHLNIILLLEDKARSRSERHPSPDTDIKSARQGLVSGCNIVIISVICLSSKCQAKPANPLLLL